MMTYFTYEEFDSPDIQGSGQLMDRRILDMLDHARHLYGKPIKINSGYRTPQHNEAVGGVSSSSHLKGLAADVSCVLSDERYKLIQILMEVGFRRLGVAKTFIHVDIDEGKAQDVIWTY